MGFDGEIKNGTGNGCAAAKGPTENLFYNFY